MLLTAISLCFVFAGGYTCALYVEHWRRVREDARKRWIPTPGETDYMRSYTEYWTGAGSPYRVTLTQFQRLCAEKSAAAGVTREQCFADILTRARVMHRLNSIYSTDTPAAVACQQEDITSLIIAAFALLSYLNIDAATVLMQAYKRYGQPGHFLRGAILPSK